MKNRISALAAAFLMCALSLVSCAAPNGGGGNGGMEKPTQKPTEKPDPPAETVQYTSSDYVKKYADNAAMNAWLNDYIDNADIPPVSFDIDGVSSDEYGWEKSVGQTYREVYFESENSPSERVFKTVTYTNNDVGLAVEMELSTYTDYPVVEYDACLYNTADGNSPLLCGLTSVNTELGNGNGDWFLHTNRGSECTHFDFEPLSYRLNGKRSLKVESGKSTSTYVPFFNLENRTAPCGVIAILNWQGNWRADFERTENGVAVSAGQGATNLVLRKGENMRFPGTVLMFYKGNRYNGQNVYRRWLYNCNLFRKQNKHMKSTNVLIGSEFSSEEGDKASIQRYVDFGISDLIDKFNIDAQWYPMNNGDWWNSTGNWYTDGTGYPNGMGVIADAAHEAGMELAVWFEPERIMNNSAAAEALGNRIITLDRNFDYATGSTVNLHDNGSSLVDYSDPTAVEYIINLLNSKLDEYKIDQYRQDFNTDPAAYWIAKDRADRTKMGIPREGYTENHYCTGYLAVYDGILREHPEMYIDACAAGGRRNDLETMRYSFMHTRSDNWGNVESAQLQTYGSSMWFMYWGTGFSSADYNDYDVRSHIGNSIGVGVSDKTQAYKLADALTDWKHFAEYLFYDYYPLTPYAGSSRETMCLQYDSPENGIGMLINYFRKNDTVKPKLKGLDPDAQYEIWDYDNPAYRRYTLSGRQLMSGFEISSAENTARVFEYKLAEGSSNLDFQKAPYDPSVEDEYSGGVKLEDVGKPVVTAEWIDVMADEYLIAHHSIVGDGKTEFITADNFAAGTVYAISKNIYDEIVTTGQSAYGWELVDRNKMFIRGGNGSLYSFTTWSDTRFQNVQPLVKNIGGKCFLWVYGFTLFADKDGDWHNDGANAIAYDKKSGGRDVADISINIENQERIRAVKTENDGSDKIYRIDEQIFASLVYDGKGIKNGEVTMYRIDPSKIGFTSDVNKIAPATEDIYANVAMLADMDRYDSDIFAYTENGEYYLYIKAAAEIRLPASCVANVPRAMFVWISADGVKHAVSFVYP